MRQAHTLRRQHARYHVYLWRPSCESSEGPFVHADLRAENAFIGHYSDLTEDGADTGPWREVTTSWSRDRPAFTPSRV